MEAKFDKIHEIYLDEVKDTYACYNLMNSELKRLILGDNFPFFLRSSMESGESYEKIEITLKDGGSFSYALNFDPWHNPGIIILFAAIVHFNDDKETHLAKYSIVFNAIPSMIAKFSKASRTDQEYCLLIQCVQYSIDSRIQSMDNKEAMITFGNKIRMHLSSSIPTQIKKIFVTQRWSLQMIICCAVNAIAIFVPERRK